MGRRGPLPTDPAIRAITGGRIRARKWAPTEAIEAWTARAKAFERLAMTLVQQGAKAKLVKTKSNGPQMNPKFAAGLKLQQAADDIWDHLYRLAPEDAPRGKGEPAPSDTLAAFRRKRHEA